MTTYARSTDDVIRAASTRLARAALSRVPCAPVRDLIGDDDELAYAIQQQLAAMHTADGRTIIGHKIGLTSPAVQAQLGVDRPDFGLLFNDMDVSDVSAGPVDIDRLLQPKIEAEVAFVLSADITAADPRVDEVRGAVAYAVAALEIVDSRIAGWDITFADTVADNASSGLFVLGQDKVSLTDFEPVDAVMSMTINGVVASTGSGAACLGDPLNALAWLAAIAVANGNPLRRGQVVLSGALGPMAVVPPGAEVRAEITGLGTVATTFSTGGSA